MNNFWRLIGNGMVATAFREQSVSKQNTVIYASGVSDSLCTDLSLFQRESEMLKEALLSTPDNVRFIYFGTCSIYEPEPENLKYVIHKRDMESKVLAHPGGIIFRLPQLAGPNPPPSTLIAHFISRIRLEQPIQVWQFAYRNIIDVHDVVKIVDTLLSGGLKPGSIRDIVCPRNVSVIELIRLIESVLRLKAQISFIPKGGNISVDFEPIRNACTQAGVEFGPHYLHKIVRKYCL